MKEQEKEPPDKEEPKQDATPQEDEKGTLPLAEGSPSQTSKDELVQTNDEFHSRIWNQKNSASPATSYSDAKSNLGTPSSTPAPKLVPKFIFPEPNMEERKHMQPQSDPEDYRNSYSVVTNLENECTYMDKHGNVVEPLGPSEVVETAEGGTTSHELSNALKSNIDSNTNNSELNNTIKNASISANAEVQTLNTESENETEFKHPRPMRRVSRISRVVTDIDVSKESQLRADAEEDRIRKARKRKKKLSPELQISKKSQWDENHAVHTQCVGSIKDTEESCGYNLITKRELLIIQRAIQDNENLKNFQSGYAIGGIQSEVNPKTTDSEKMEINQTSEAEKSEEHEVITAEKSRRMMVELTRYKQEEERENKEREAKRKLAAQRKKIYQSSGNEKEEKEGNTGGKQKEKKLNFIKHNISKEDLKEAGTSKDNIKPQEPLEKYVEAKNKMPRTELKHMKQFENKPENTVEILKTQKELNLLLDEDECDGIPYIKLAEARLKTLYDHWLEVLTEEHKNEIETWKIKQIGKQKETGKQEEKRKLEILNKRDSISSSFKIPTENRYGVLASEEHTQESANDTDAEAKPAKITDSQKRAERRKKKKFRDMGNEQAKEQGQIEPGNVTDSKKAPPKSKPGIAQKQDPKNMKQKMMPPIVITGILQLRGEALVELQEELEKKCQIKFNHGSRQTTLPSNSKMEVKVEVEYCTKCGHQIKFQELAKHLEERHPSLKLNGHEGRRGSFEVTVNDTLVHSKLSTISYPDYDDLSKIIKEVREGKPVRTPCKQQPITSCAVA
ncbi:hypothetical protein JTB14_025415 [Gonioctena quinquepunctata]|nr:hypothetical protein JTB14_025415 [Gonioctena quinquepunctata]